MSRPQTFTPLGEFDLIDRIRQYCAPADKDLVLSVGDDCAAWRPVKGELEVATVDSLVEGVHFDLADCSPAEAGWKALAASLSDIAAMGAAPRYALVALSGPANVWGTARTLELYKGMKPLAARHGIRIAGGNLTRAPGGLTITVAMTGTVPERELLRRSGARPGDSVYVTGVPGRAAMWLELRKRPRTAREFRDLFRQVHYRPEPPVEFARRLAQKRLASAAIDISDGIVSDLAHILKASDTPGATLHLDRLPVSVAHLLLREAVKETGPYGHHRFALTGGEDYELMFTAPERSARAIAGLAAELGVRVTRIGEITRKSGIRISAPGQRPEPFRGTGGFRHF